MKVNIVNNSINNLPSYARLGDAGMDVKADFSKGLNDKFFFFADFDDERKVLIIFPGGRALIPTNLHVAIPNGYEIQVRPRSGKALKEGVSVLNTPGTIDSGYRDSVGVILVNFGEEPIEVSQGDRIAQIVLKQFETIEWEEVDKLPSSERGLTGFGDSGNK